MECNSEDLLEVLTIVAQYEKSAYIFTDNETGVLHIDGLKASRQMTQYERSVLKRHGFETGEEFGIRQINSSE